MESGDGTGKLRARGLERRVKSLRLDSCLEALLGALRWRGGNGVDLGMGLGGGEGGDRGDGEGRGCGRGLGEGAWGVDSLRVDVCERAGKGWGAWEGTEVEVGV